MIMRGRRRKEDMQRHRIQMTLSKYYSDIAQQKKNIVEGHECTCLVVGVLTQESVCCY